MDENDLEKGKTEILILTKKDEQERVQKKTFTNWVNTYLIMANPPYKIDDICVKIQDGLCLIHLLQTMTGEKLRHENPRNMQRIHKLSNINTALEFLKNKKIKLVNINATDIADGKPAIVLGLVWSVILFFQIEEQEDILYGSLGDQFKGKGNAKKALLCWVNKTIGKKYNLSVTDFGSCWRDGKAFNALVHNINPRLIDWHGVQSKDNQINLSRAFLQAEKLGIPNLIDPLDVDVEKPDEKSIMTYITQFLKAYPDGGKSIEDEIIAKRKMKEEAALKEKEDNLKREAEINRKELEERERLIKEEDCRRKAAAEKQRYHEEVERKRREEDERKRREEDERKRREEDERKRKEEDERKLREEDNRKRREEDDQKRKEEDEQKRKEEDERKRKEEIFKQQQNEERIRKADNERERILKEECSNREIMSAQIEHIHIWLEDMTKYLDNEIFCDTNSIQSFLNDLNNFLEDKDSIDTGVAGIKEDVKLGRCGKDYVNQFQSDILEIEKNLKSSNSRANCVTTSLGLNATQLKSCESKLDVVLEWIDLSNEILKGINNISSPEQYELKFNKFKAHLSEKKKAVDALKSAKNIHSKLKSMAPKNLNDEYFQKRIKNLESLLQKTIDDQDAICEAICEFNNSLAKARNRQKYFIKKISEVDLTTDDLEKLRHQLENIEKLKRSLSADENIIEDVREQRQKVVVVTSNLLSIQNKIISDAKVCEYEWQSNLENIGKLMKDVVDKLEKYEDLIECGNKFNDWFKEKEEQLKSYKKPCDSLSEKEAQVDELNKLLQEIEFESSSIDKYLMDFKEMSTSEKIIGNKLSSTMQHKDILMQSIKESIEFAEEKVKRHEEFNAKLDSADEWINNANTLKADATINETTGNIEVLKRRMEIIDQLLISKKNGELVIKTAIASGDSVSKDSSSKGKEDVLNVLRALNNDFIQVFDGLGSKKQNLMTQLGKATNIIRDLDNLKKWTGEYERNEANIKPDDLDKIKEYCDDAQSKMYLADNVINQANSLGDQNLELNAFQVKDQVKTNFENIQKMYGNMRENLKKYNDFIKSCCNIDSWLNEMVRKTTRYAEPIELSLEDLNLWSKTLEKMAEETKEKRSDLEKVGLEGNELTWSYPLKSEEITCMLDKLNEKHDNLLNDIKDFQSVISDELSVQNNFQDAYHKAIRWLNDSTQQLLKCSDIRRCSISLLNEFTRNLESIINEIPHGDDIIGFAIQFEQHRLDGLRKISLNDRDVKKIRDLEANWDEFKKQADLAHGNLQRIKDSQAEFEVMQERLQASIDDKEKRMRNSSSSEIFKYLLDEVDGLGENIEHFQKKAVDISASLSSSDAPGVARELAERYNKFKRALEEEIRQVKRFENDWAEYKNNLNTCEKWIVDTGFRLIEHDFCADSPEDAQVKLDECLFICDEIENFKLEIVKMKNISKHMTEKMILSQNYSLKEKIVSRDHESEIEADIDHLDNSYQNVLGNSYQIKSQLEEQLTNWRKYRDVVQRHDIYLTSNLFEWWLEIRSIDPHMMDDVGQYLRESEGILQDLLARKMEMETSHSSCQSVTQGIVSRTKVYRRAQSSTPLYRLAQSVEERMTNHIVEIERYIQELQKNKLENEMFDRDMKEFELWITRAENSLDMKIAKPGFKYSYSTDVQLLEYERLQEEIYAHEKGLNNLLKMAQFHRKRQINSLIQRIEDLKRNLKMFRKIKDKDIDAVDYSKKEIFLSRNPSLQNIFSGTIATQTAPEMRSLSTSTFPLVRRSRDRSIDSNTTYNQPSNNGFGLRNSGTNRGLSKMLYPYCCTSDLLNQRLHLDFVHGTVLRNQRNEQKLYKASASTFRERGGQLYGRQWGKAQNFN